MVDWLNRKKEDWLGKTIVSQYRLICEVIDAKEEDGKIVVTCSANYKDKIWEWTTDTISLVTKEKEILDSNGEIFGKIVNKDSRVDYELYKDDRCRVISQEEIDKEWIK